MLLQLKVREKPKVVRSLRQYAPLWLKAEQHFFSMLEDLSRGVLPMHCSVGMHIPRVKHT
jgi:hypothetical protein